jgi:hypothetical protein
MTVETKSSSTSSRVSAAFFLSLTGGPYPGHRAISPQIGSGFSIVLKRAFAIAAWR